MFLIGYTNMLIIIIMKNMVVQFIYQSASISAHDFIEVYLSFKF